MRMTWKQDHAYEILTQEDARILVGRVIPSFLPEKPLHWVYRQGNAELSLLLEPPYGGREGVRFSLALFDRRYYKDPESIELDFSQYSELQEICRILGVPEPPDIRAAWERMISKYGIDPLPINLGYILDELSGHHKDPGIRKTDLAEHFSRLCNPEELDKWFKPDELEKLKRLKQLYEEGKLQD